MMRENPKDQVMPDVKLEADSFGVNLDTLESNFKRCQEASQMIKDKEVVIFVGVTGSGKTTVVNQLAGCSYRRYMDKELQQHQLIPVQNSKEVIPVSHKSAESDTYFPTTYFDPDTNLIYCDLPGSCHSHLPLQSICADLSLPLILNQAISLKAIIIVIDSQIFHHGRVFDSFEYVVRDFINIIQASMLLTKEDTSSINHPVFFVFTHAEDELNEEHILSRAHVVLEELKNRNELESLTVQKVTICEQIENISKFNGIDLSNLQTRLDQIEKKICKLQSLFHFLILLINNKDQIYFSRINGELSDISRFKRLLVKARPIPTASFLKPVLRNNIIEEVAQSLEYKLDEYASLLSRLQQNKEHLFYLDEVTQQLSAKIKKICQIKFDGEFSDDQKRDEFKKISSEIESDDNRIIKLRLELNNLTKTQKELTFSINEYNSNDECVAFDQRTEVFSWGTNYIPFLSNVVNRLFNPISTIQYDGCTFLRAKISSHSVVENKGGYNLPDSGKFKINFSAIGFKGEMHVRIIAKKSEFYKDKIQNIKEEQLKNIEKEKNLDKELNLVEAEKLRRMHLMSTLVQENAVSFDQLIQKFENEVKVVESQKQEWRLKCTENEQKCNIARIGFEKYNRWVQFLMLIEQTLSSSTGLPFARENQTTAFASFLKKKSKFDSQHSDPNDFGQNDISVNKVREDNLSVVNSLDQTHTTEQSVPGQSLKRFIKNYKNNTFETLVEIQDRLHKSTAFSMLQRAAIAGHLDYLTEFKRMHEDDLFARQVSDSHTALEYACAFDRLEFVGGLLDLGAADHDTPQVNFENIYRCLEIAVASNNTNLLLLLLQHPASKESMRSQDQLGDTLFHTAARFDSVQALATLVAMSDLSLMDFNTINGQGQTPVHIAAANGSRNVLRYLSKQNINLNIKVSRQLEINSTTREERSREVELELKLIPSMPLHFAIINDQRETIIDLLHYGVEIDDCAHQLKSGKFNNLLIAEKSSRNAAQRVLIDYRKKYQTKLSHIRNLVLKGGGVKGIAHVGVLLELENTEGPAFFKNLKRVAGTSAGAINAFLVAIGYTPKHVAEKMKEIDFKDFMDGPHQLIINKLIECAAKGFDASKFISYVSRPLDEAYKQGKKMFNALGGAAIALKQARWLSLAKNIAKAAAHGYVGYDMVATQIDTITADLKEINEIQTAIREKYGLFPGQQVLKLFRQYLRDAQEDSLDETLTFAELHILHLRNPEKYKELYLVVTNLSQGRVEILSYENEKLRDVRIIDAVRASMSVPLFFEPHQLRKKDGSLYSDDLYVDGGLLVNYPIAVFDRLKYVLNDDLTQYKDRDSYVYNKETLGLCLATSNQIARFRLEATEQKSENISGLFKYFERLLTLYANHEEDAHMRSTDRERSVYIDVIGISTLDFALDSNRQTSLIHSGEIGLIEFHRNLYTQAQSKVNKSLFAFLVEHSENIMPTITSRGFCIENLKISLADSADLFKLLSLIKNNDDLQFIKMLPIDWNYSRPDTKQNILHYILEHYDTDNKPDISWRVLTNLLKLEEGTLDMNALDRNNLAPLDLASQLDIKVICELIKHGSRLCCKNDNYLAIKRKLFDIQLNQIRGDIEEVRDLFKQCFDYQSNPQFLQTLGIFRLRNVQQLAASLNSGTELRKTN